MRLPSGGTWTKIFDIVQPNQNPGNPLPDVPCALVGASNQGTAVAPANDDTTSGDPLAMQVFKNGADDTAHWAFTVAQPDATNFPWRFQLSAVVPANYDSLTIQIIGNVSFYGMVYCGLIDTIEVGPIEANTTKWFNRVVTVDSSNMPLVAAIDANGPGINPPAGTAAIAAAKLTETPNIDSETIVIAS